MTTFALSQQWVSKVTMSEEPDASVVGAVLVPAPTRDELNTVLEELSRSETVREISRRKWIRPAASTLKNRVAERSNALMDLLTAQRTVTPSYAMFKGRRPSAKQALLDDFATRVWVGHLTQRAHGCPMATTFRAPSIDHHFLTSLAQLSTRADGPTLALDAVRELGICVILESGLPGMSVDGASFHVAGAPPVVALTARHDRLDNFWFTLFHEIGHIALHLGDPGTAIFVDAEEDNGSDEVEAEAEANAFAKDSLIPRDIWLRSDAYRSGSEASVVALAKQLGIHPAIVAGRIRYERRDFRIFNDLIGRGQVREVVLGG
jgi:HTH-type transcriptional regulator/antitoxin HigA